MEFRTVQYQGADTKSQPYIGVPDGQAALESNANYQKGQIQRSGEALLQQNNLIARNQERVDSIEQENARISAAQMSARNDVALKASQMVGEQKLNNLKMSEDQRLEIQKLQLTHQMQRDEFDLRSKQQQAEALTQFGQQMIQFSTTLWKAKADDINKKNQEMKALGMMDEILGLGKTTVSDQIRVDQSQHTRLAKNAEAMQLADSLEKAGLPNDAARVRSSNPWYLHGRQEMAIIKGSSEMPDYLRKVARQAEQAGLLQKGDPDYDVKLRAVVYDGMKNFLQESGIANMNPTLVARYLQEGFLNSMTSITKEFNSENNKYVKQATAANALGDAFNSENLWAGDPKELNRVVSSVLINGGYEGLKDLLEGTMKRARLNGDDSAVRALMAHPALKVFEGDYAGFEKTRRAEAQAAMEKEQNDRTNALIADFELRASKLPSGADLPGLRAEFEKHMPSLPLEQARRLEKALYAFNPQDAGHMADRVNHVIEYGDANDLAELARNNPNLSNSQRADIQKAIQAKQKVAEDPAIKAQIQAAKNRIHAPANLPAKVKAQAMINPYYKSQIDLILKQREEAMEQAAIRYWMQPDATAAGFQKFVEEQQHLINKEITLDELGYQAKVPNVTTAIPPNASVNYNGRPVVWMTEPGTRAALIRGSYGDVNPNKSVVMTKDEIISWDSEYGRTGVYPNDLLTLAVRTRTKPQDLLRIQAQMHNLKGTLSEPPKTGLSARPAAGPAPGAGQPVTKQYAHQAALSAGLSPRGAVWFSTNMMDESSGRPTAIHDGGDGYGLFGHQGGRLAAMRQYAAARGIDISDGPTQIQFALNEIKTKYPAVWAVVSAPNPSLNDLWRASRQWEGFAESVYTQRFNSLRTALGE